MRQFSPKHPLPIAGPHGKATTRADDLSSAPPTAGAVGERLRVVRLRRRLGQRAVAGELGVTQQAISLAELGRCGAGLRIRFADLLGVELTDAEALARREAGST